MQRFLGVVPVLAAICLVGFSGWAQAETIVYFVRDGEAVPVHLADYAEVSGTVAYQGPVMDDGGQNWKDPHAYTGVPILSIVEGLGGLAAEETLGVVAVDGWYKILPSSVVYGASAAGPAALATAVDGTDPAEWVDAPMLVFLSEDERFSNDDMLEAFGPSLAHYFGDYPSTTGMMVRGVAYLVVNYDGEPLPLPTSETAAEDTTAPGSVLLKVAKGETTLEFTLSDLEALDVVAGPGTFTNSAGVDYTATYTGVPLTTLVGNVPPDSTVRVTASDGYSMNYAVEMIADTSEGVWIVAFMENGEYMPHDPGPLRIVRIGEDNPHFTSALSARRAWARRTPTPASRSGA
jgi:hypothetical protein